MQIRFLLDRWCNLSREFEPKFMNLQSPFSCLRVLNIWQKIRRACIEIFGYICQQIAPRLIEILLHKIRNCIWFQNSTWDLSIRIYGSSKLPNLWECPEKLCLITSSAFLDWSWFCIQCQCHQSHLHSTWNITWHHRIPYTTWDSRDFKIRPIFWKLYDRAANHHPLTITSVYAVRLCSWGMEV